MKNNRGFTLVEVLLAAMIVGLIGVALSALTTAAIRESNVGRARMILRNQLSLAMRQLRQDIHQSTDAEVTGTGLTLYQTEHGASGGSPVKLGPDHKVGTIVYQYEGGQITRTADGKKEVLLPFVKNTSGNQAFADSSLQSPRFRVVNKDGGWLGDGFTTNSILQVQIILEMNTNPVVSEAVDETFVLPQGFSIKYFKNLDSASPY